MREGGGGWFCIIRYADVYGTYHLVVAVVAVAFVPLP